LFQKLITVSQRPTIVSQCLITVSQNLKVVSQNFFNTEQSPENAGGSRYDYVSWRLMDNA